MLAALVLLAVLFLDLQLQCLLTIKQIKLRHQLTEIKNFVETQPTKTRIGQVTKGFKRKSKYLICSSDFILHLPSGADVDCVVDQKKD